MLKEFPVLGPAPSRRSQVGVAVRMQDKTGKKYLDFHSKLLNGRGQVDKARALAAAKEVGLDMARLDKDLASEEVRASLDESFKLAEALGLNGTPSYVIGEDVVMRRRRRRHPEGQGRRRAQVSKCEPAQAGGCERAQLSKCEQVNESVIPDPSLRGASDSAILSSF